MRTFFLPDELSRMHWAVLKTVFLTFLILPISHFLAQMIGSVQGSSQIMVGFIGISLISATIIIAFTAALKMTIWQTSIAVNPTQQIVLRLYRHVPMLFFVSLFAFALCQHT
ncbi:hypothetical protein F4V57_07705 [Acinetobacter qingfengensis]|uniref:Uncharacterized protein n=1 Tax=Acinetobacter qingfengensis TaxID=1262585 RepID=A0A1E7R9Y6_9GAMM|nr:hypothetical protein [Acinetobacter qingfengensis]KAA8733925.1 hypothetical protein F4V57_07705 [Acinetobacter qingfengensis]OEY96156.1 hypothetical protein BJI46_12320 [Acinetobacter qingfengensis]